MSSPPPPTDGDGAEEESGGNGGGRALSYGEAEYWDARYVEEGGAPYDWYQRYDALRPFVSLFAPPASRLLMIGCGSALMSEDMVNDGYVEIVNIDISSVVIEMMRKKYLNIPQLQYLRMDVRDMSMFSDESFDCAIDKGTLDSLMCGVDAPLSAAQMVLEVDRFLVSCCPSIGSLCSLACTNAFHKFRHSCRIISSSFHCRLLRPGGVFILITYGDPSVRVPHLNQPGCDWKIVLYILPRPGFQGKIKRSVLDPVALTERGRLPDGFVLEDPDSHYVYVCKKMQGLTGTSSPTMNHIEKQKG